MLLIFIILKTIVAVDRGIMPLTLYNFFFVKYMNIDFKYIITLYTINTTLIYNPIHYENNLEFDFQTFP